MILRFPGRKIIVLFITLFFINLTTTIVVASSPVPGILTPIPLPSPPVGDCPTGYYTYQQPLKAGAPTLDDLFTGKARFQNENEKQLVQLHFDPASVTDVWDQKMPILYNQVDKKYYTFTKGYDVRRTNERGGAPNWSMTIFLLKSDDGVVFEQAGQVFPWSTIDELGSIYDAQIAIDYSVCPVRYVMALEGSGNMYISYTTTPFNPASWSKPKKIVEQVAGRSTSTGVFLIDGSRKYASWTVVDGGTPVDSKTRDYGTESTYSRAVEVSDLYTDNPYLGKADIGESVMPAEANTHCTSSWDCNNRDKQDWKKEGGWYYLIYNGANYYGCRRFAGDSGTVDWGIGIVRSASPLSGYDMKGVGKIIDSKNKGICGISYPVVNNIGGELFLYYAFRNSADAREEGEKRGPTDNEGTYRSKLVWVGNNSTPAPSASASVVPTQLPVPSASSDPRSKLLTLYDLNNDGVINTVDFATLYREWRKGAEGSPGLDFNKDGKINSFDYAILAKNYRLFRSLPVSASPAAATVSEIKVNNTNLSLTGTPLPVKLALAGGSNTTDLPVQVKLSDNSTRNFVIRFVYRPAASPSVALTPAPSVSVSITPLAAASAASSPAPEVSPSISPSPSPLASPSPSPSESASAAPAVTASPAALAVSEIKVNSVDLSLTGTPLSVTLTPLSGSNSVDLPIQVKLNNNSSRNLVIRFIYRAAATVTDFYGDPVKFLKLFGQTKITESSRNKVTANKIYHASGVMVDRSSTPNKVYVVDTGNNRVLGFDGIGKCSADSGKSCNIDSDCGSGTCITDGTKNADIVFGQPDFESAACNRDNNLGFTKRPTADTLCMTGYPFSTNIAEYWMRANIDIDSEGNLYMIDTWNNRVLKFNQPFSTDKSSGKGDTVADFVIGQKDFTSNGINQNPTQSTYGSSTHPSNKSLWVNAGPPDHVAARGVSVDNSGNVWIADTFNNRVLRFPSNSKEADLFLGQSSFTSTGCVPNGSLDKMCTPTIAKIDPDTGKLYVVDEYPNAFKARILVFNPPFTNGMAAAKSIVLTEGPSGYIFSHATGFAFNPYKVGDYATGKLWIHDSYNRTLLIDDYGHVVKVIGAIDKDHGGGDFAYAGCRTDIYQGFNLWTPGGSIGFDSANNLYLADERFHRISRYALPYETHAEGTTTCLPLPNGGLFAGTGANIRSDEKLDESIGTMVYGNQLIINDGNAIKVWNDYTNKSIGSTPDTVVRGGTPGGIWFGDAVDDTGKFWMFNEWGKLRVYQLPFRGGDLSLADNLQLYWKDTGDEIAYGFFETGLTFDKAGKALYIADSHNHRILRIKNYIEYDRKLYVDMVIGQPDKTTVKCNHNQDMPWRAAGSPTADSLCDPRQVKFDNLGNLYVVENMYECHGNDRITVFLNSDLRSVLEGTMFPNLSAKKVFGPSDLNSQGPCAYDTTGSPGSPTAIAFNSANQMIVGNDGYYGDAQQRQLRQLWFYKDPLNKQTPDAYINLPLGSAGEVTFDSANNLIVQDHTWNKVWVINPGVDPFWLVSIPGGLPIVYPTPTSR